MGPLLVADVSFTPMLVLGTLTAGYWHLGLKDMQQSSHAIRRNYPVLGNMRYILETVRACVCVFVSVTLGPVEVTNFMNAVFYRDVFVGAIFLNISQIRPELRQYIVEADNEGKPYNRLQRTQIYQRAKHVDDTMPFGTRRNVYEVHHEWACHSLWPETAVPMEQCRYTIGTSNETVLGQYF